MFIGIAGVTHSPTCVISLLPFPGIYQEMELADLSHQCRSTLPHSFRPDAQRLTTAVYTVERTLGPWLVIPVMAGGYHPKTPTESLVMHHVLNSPTLGASCHT